MYANPVIFVIFWVPICRGKVYVVPRPLPNHQNKQLENTDQVYWHAGQSFADYLRKIDLVCAGLIQ